MYITDDGIRLNIKIDMPIEKTNKCPMVIIIHGFTGHIEERHIIAAARACNEMGFATLRVDMYGHGSSDGKFEDHNLFKWMNNALAVIDYARTLDFVTDIYLCGHSQGGLMVVLAGALKHDLIKGIIPMSPAVMIPESARKGELLNVHFDPDNIPEYIVNENDWKLKGNYARVAQTINVDEAIDRYDGPVLIIHGDADEAVPYKYGAAAAERYKNAELVCVPGDTHCYDHHLEQVVEALKTWLAKR